MTHSILFVFGGGFSAVFANTTVACWGDNSYGQLGARNAGGLLPALVPGLSGVTQLTAGYFHAAALLQNGSVLSWGRNEFGQLGDATKTNRFEPNRVAGLDSVTIADISAGYMHTCVLTNAGAMKCFGYNGVGQLGDGTTTDSAVPVSVQGLGADVTYISMGYLHSW